MFIDGQWINAKNNDTFPVFNPANGDKIGDVANGDHEDTANAVDAAQRAFDKWSTLTAYQRSSYLYDAYRIMTDNREHLACTMTEEQGKPLKAARNEVQYGADFLLIYTRVIYPGPCGFSKPCDLVSSGSMISIRPLLLLLSAA